MGTTLESETMDTSGKAFVEFWTRRAERGDLNANTAGGLRAAVKAVLEVDEGWETLDVKALDVERMLVRFRNRAANDLKGESLRAYERRFRQAHRSFLEFVDNPAAWRPPAQAPTNGKREGKKDRAATNATGEAEPVSLGPAPGVATANTIDYPFPLRDGALIARLRLPIDLTTDEADQLYTYIKALARPPKRLPFAPDA
jgi:hypothetical protein